MWEAGPFAHAAWFARQKLLSFALATSIATPWHTAVSTA